MKTPKATHLLFLLALLTVVPGLALAQDDSGGNLFAQLRMRQCESDYLLDCWVVH